MHVVIRYSSLGDIVLTGAVTAVLADVHFLTHRRYHDLARRLDGVVGVLAPGDPLPKGARVIDLHNNLRSRRLGADVRVERQDLRRRLHVAFKTRPADPVIARYARAAGVLPKPPPWMPTVARGDALVIAPGAAHPAKRWPWWADLAKRWPGPVRAVGGPGDEALVAAFGGTCTPDFEATLEAYEGAAVVCAGDTGPLHLAAAVGLPVVGIFGPTTSHDGFYSYGGAAVELPLSCRPCSIHGGSTCPIGDHLCMRGIEVDAVLAACLRAAG